jgi:hypothetical protein
MHGLQQPDLDRLVQVTGLLDLTIVERHRHQSLATGESRTNRAATEDAENQCRGCSPPDH